ncbi:MAG: polyprenyl synthetase family protein [Desulfitobacterium sp.]
MTPLTSADSPSTLTGVEAPASDPVISFPELLIVEEKLRESFQRADSTIKDSCLQLLSSGGKRLRPLLTLQSAQCFGTLNLAIIDAAVAAELIHMASLIHDDVIDFSELRRGVQTINAQQGNQIAVLAGDYVFAEAFRILANKHLHTCMSYLVDAIQAMCDGEVQQASDHFNLTVDSSQYFTRIAQKTGILLSSCCACGAASAGASQTDIDSMGLYGMNLGYAYQIIDDILDFTGNPYVTGKPVAADLSNGNITLPMIYLLEKPLYGPWAAEILQKKELSPRDSERILQALISSEALDEAFSAALHCAQAAVASLNSLPASSAKTFLIKLTQTILYRKA